ncbi:MAG TPA: hypothetical protein VF186_08565 [Gaiellaceae bacterium]
MDADAQRELDATVAARRELGPEHEEHLVERFLERIEKEIDRRVDDRVARRQPRQFGRQELAVAVPIIAVAGIFGGPGGVIVALVVIAAVFLTLTLSRR